jgi:hypothetical protein
MSAVPEDVASDPAEAVDADLDGHAQSCLFGGFVLAGPTLTKAARGTHRREDLTCGR